MAEKRKVPLDPLLLNRARAMRHDAAPAGKKLWAMLRNRQLGGWKFRRQVPLGGFIADLYCHELDLVVELDGESHVERQPQDRVRTEILQRDGRRVIRFWNPDVFENLDGVLEAIYDECARLALREPPHPNPLPPGEGVEQAVAILRRGGLVAFPTETVYGLGADATNARAIRRLFEVKGRPSTNPLIVHVANEAVARRYARDWPLAASRLVERFWPGPLTLVLPKETSIVSDVTAGLETVGLRAPDHPLAVELLRAFDGPIAGPSANKSSHVSPTTAQHVRDEFPDDEIELIVDGGPCAVGIESTVLDLGSEPYRILRPGAVGREEIEAVVGRSVEQRTLTAEAVSPAVSPGLHEKHYAPRTPAFRVEPGQVTQLDLSDAALVDVTLDPQAYARRFYANLRMRDAQRLRAIYVVLPPDAPEWAAVRDRIMRATRPLPEA